jgi:hypothetical protein
VQDHELVHTVLLSSSLPEIYQQSSVQDQEMVQRSPSIFWTWVGLPPSAVPFTMATTYRTRDNQYLAKYDAVLI